MKFVWVILVNAAALGIAAWLFDGISLAGRDRSDQIVTLVVVGGILGVINSVIAPAVKLLSLPLIILTLGLMLIVINALMLMLTSKIADTVGLDFYVHGFWTAFFGSIVISIATMVIESVLPVEK